MNNVIQFSSYIDDYLYYEKNTEIEGKILKTIIRINKKLVSPYNVQLIKSLF